MNREEAEQYMRTHPEKVLEPDRSGKGFICPSCGSGSGTHGTGITTKDGIHYRCWACGDIENADIFDLIAVKNGIGINTPFPDKVKAAEKAFGIRVDDSSSYRPKEPRKQQFSATEKPEEKPDHTSFFLQANEALRRKPDIAAHYLINRGLTIDTAIATNVGYVECWKHPSAPEWVPGTPRLIFPTGEHSYTTRDIRSIDDIPEESREDYETYKKQIVGHTGIFFLQALDNTTKQPVIVTEGELDALSVMDTGHPALSIGSSTNADKFIKTIKERRAAGAPIPHLIICMDNDEAGKRAAGVISAALTQLKIPFSIADICGDCNDPNEAMMNEKDGFSQRVGAVCWDILTEEPEGEPIEADRPDEAEGFGSEREQLEAANKTERQMRLDALLFDRDAYHTRISETVERLKTGMPTVDKLLGEGIYPGLIMLGGRTGTGKTTFALQIAYEALTAGRSVLYAALEMDRDEVAAKMLSMIANQNRQIPVSFGYLLDGHESADLERVEREYQSGIAKRFYVLDVENGINVDRIKTTARDIKDELGQPPIVMVDYLQLLRPTGPYMTAQDAAKQNSDALKLLNKTLKTPVLAITSYNRASYNTAEERTDEQWFDILEAAGKDSGDLEYTADVVLGLRVTGRELDGIQERLYIIKNRRKDGHLSVDLLFSGAKGRFDEKEHKIKKRVTDSGSLDERRKRGI